MVLNTAGVLKHFSFGYASCFEVIRGGNLGHELAGYRPEGGEWVKGGTLYGVGAVGGEAMKGGGGGGAVGWWWRSWLRGLSPHDVVISLIVANVAIFLLWRLADPRFMYKNFTISVENFKSGRLHTLITSAFSHMDIDHILHNMIGLYFFGVHGASGAVNAIILLDIFLFPKSTLYLNFFIPIPAILLGDTPGSAHLGGGVVAAVAWARLRRGRF
ncbi:hypothetical protein L484_019062 [Morus notabilis]|uniref:Peptidase S54 rhomboid domain-containing protein n=1 Tax=Morus notabilis TaxID=981085 RepID=W9S1V3_9ROSA|nr:hypothetical protein L484_019062 [Morus notabilis]